MIKRKKIVLISSVLLMAPTVLSTSYSTETPVQAAEDNQTKDNLILNGDFSEGTDHWETWNGEGGESSFDIEDEQAVITIESIAGMHPEWGVPISWSSQLNQDGIDLEANHRYVISFDAQSSVERPITVERTNLSENPQSHHLITEEMQTFEVEFSTLQSGTMMLNFLFGNVQQEGAETPEDEHTLTFDNISVQSLGEVVEEEAEREWELTWSDEFEGDSLDSSRWNIDTGNGFYNEGEWISGWGNNELQYYDEENVRVEDGRLILEAKEEERSDEYGEYDYTSGKITSEGLFSQAYGRFEASMKLPEGQGYWPAFWMMPEDDVYGGWAASGEIDIMENRGSETNQVSGAIHYGGIYPNNTYSEGAYRFDEGSTQEFNTYAVEWEPEEIRWYVNDELFYRTGDWHSEEGEYPAPFDQEFHLILNLAVGGWFGGDPDDTTEFPRQVEVEYVRAYEDVNANHEASAAPADSDVDADQSDEGDASDLDEGTEEDAETTTGEGLPQTATILWTIGAIGLIGLVAGLGMKYFRRK